MLVNQVVKYRRHLCFYHHGDERNIALKNEGYISSVTRFLFQDWLYILNSVTWLIVIDACMALRLLFRSFVVCPFFFIIIFFFCSVFCFNEWKLLSLSLIPRIRIKKRMKYCCTDSKLGLSQIFIGDWIPKICIFKMYWIVLTLREVMWLLLLN